MSSPLDSRMRAIAREEAAALLGVLDGVQTGGDSASTTEQMQEQITILHEHLHHAATTISGLEGRVAALEEATTKTSAPARRASRKVTDTPE